MAIRPILLLSLQDLNDGASLLRKASEPMSLADAPQIVADLRDTLYASEIAVGLSAVQIGYPKRIFIVNTNKSEKEKSELIAVNPTVVREWGEKKKMKESCMSIPDYRGTVPRRSKLTLRYTTLEGEAVERSFDGFEARVILHELDHLDGILYPDRMTAAEELERVDFFTRNNYPLQSGRESSARDTAVSNNETEKPME